MTDSRKRPRYSTRGFWWTDAKKQEGIDLRASGKDWATIADALGVTSADAVRIKIGRLLKAGWRATKSLGADAPPYETEPTFAKYTYHFTDGQFFFPINGTIVSIPRDTWAGIVVDYAVEGGNMTQHQIAMKYGMHKKVVEACLRMYGHFKTRPPALREELTEPTEETLEPMYDRAIEVAERAFYSKLHIRKGKEALRKVEELQAELAEQRDIRQAAKHLLSGLSDGFSCKPTPAPRWERTLEAADFHLPAYDLHFGMAAYDRQFDHELPTYTAEVAAGYLRGVADEFVRRITMSGYRARTTHFTNGGDLFHAFMGRTKKGTPITAGLPDRVVFRYAIEAHCYVIRRLLAVSERVDVRMVRGNHDHLFLELFEEALALFFANEPRVRFDHTLGKRKSFRVGETLHVLDHGEGFQHFGPQQMFNADVLAREVGRAAYHGATQIVLWVGHTHHLEKAAVRTQETNTGAHLRMVRLPSLAQVSEYEEGLVLAAPPEVTFYRLSEQGRIEGEESISAKALDRQMPITL